MTSLEVATVQSLGVLDEVGIFCVLRLIFFHQLVDDGLDEGWGMVRLRGEVQVPIHWLLVGHRGDPSPLDRDREVEEHLCLSGILCRPRQLAERQVGDEVGPVDASRCATALVADPDVKDAVNPPG